MNRYWVSWISGYYSDEGCSKPPFKVWISGQMERRSGHPSKFEGTENEKDDCTICSMIDAHSEEEIWEAVKKYFPDYAPRFIEPRASDAKPGDRFPGFDDNLTKLK